RGSDSSDGGPAIVSEEQVTPASEENSQGSPHEARCQQGKGRPDQRPQPERQQQHQDRPLSSAGRRAGLASGGVGAGSAMPTPPKEEGPIPLQGGPPLWKSQQFLPLTPIC